jgi:hypothetical protein
MYEWQVSTKTCSLIGTGVKYSKFDFHQPFFWLIRWQIISGLKHQVRDTLDTSYVQKKRIHSPLVPYQRLGWNLCSDEGCWKKEKTGTEWGKGTNNWRLK